MTALSGSVSPTLARVESQWDEVFIVTPRSHPHEALPRWRPAVNAYRCFGEFVIFVDLAGVPAESIAVEPEANRLTIRGRRPAPEPSCHRSELAQLLALEIDQGAFARVLDLSHEIDPAGMKTEYRDGLLQIRLPLVP